MAVHHGGKVSAAAKTLAKNSSSKAAKSKAVTPWPIIKPKITANNDD